MTVQAFQKSWYIRIVLLIGICMVVSSCAVHAQTAQQTQAPMEAATKSMVEEAPGDTVAEPSEQEQEPVNLTITLWSSDSNQLALFNEIASEYKSEHPNVSVTYMSIPFADYVSKVTVQLAGSNPPDAGWIVDSTAPTFIQAGVVKDLRPTLEANADYDLADFAEGPMTLWEDENAIYGVPFSTSPYIIFYNKDLFQKAGIDTPDVLLEQGNWTWDSLRAASKAIKDVSPEMVYGFESYGGDIYGARLWNTMGSLMKAYGGQAWDDAGTQCTINSAESVAAFQFMHDMIFVDGSAVPPGEIGDFFAGNAGMTLAQLGRTAVLADAAFQWDIAPLPSGPNGYKPTVGQAAFVVFNASKNADVAADYIAFMTNKVNVAKIAAYFPPARKSIINSSEFLSSNSLVSPESMKLAIADSIETGTVEVVHPEYPKIDLAAHGEIDKIWKLDADVQAALDKTCEAIQPLMLE